MPARDPAVRRSVAIEAALLRWSKEDPRANAERGQAGLRRKFYDATDSTLPETERQRRADCAYRAHMVRIRRGRASQGAA